MERVERGLKPARHVKEMAVCFRCIRWVLECINKFKKHVMHVKEKVKLLMRLRNVKGAKEKKFSTSKK